MGGGEVRVLRHVVGASNSNASRELVGSDGL